MGVLDEHTTHHSAVLGYNLTAPIALAVDEVAYILDLVHIGYDTTVVRFGEVNVANVSPVFFFIDDDAPALFVEHVPLCATDMAARTAVGEEDCTPGSPGGRDQEPGTSSTCGRTLQKQECSSMSLLRHQATQAWYDGEDQRRCGLWAVGSPVVITLGRLVDGRAPLVDVKDRYSGLRGPSSSRSPAKG